MKFCSPHTSLVDELGDMPAHLHLISVNSLCIHQLYYGIMIDILQQATIEYDVPVFSLDRRI